MVCNNNKYDEVKT